MKGNVDAHVLNNRIIMTVVFRDSMGHVLVGSTRNVVWTPKLAETVALRYGCQLAQRLGYQRIIFESDAKEVIDAVYNQKLGCSSFHVIVSDILFLARRFLNVEWSFVKRDFNKVAHHLARVNFVGDRMVWWGSCPAGIISRISSNSII